MTSQENLATQFAALAAAVQPKLRPFNAEEAELWFANAEFQFETSNPKITMPMTKFQYVCMALTPEVQRQVKDIIIRPPEDPYRAVKDRLCDVYRPSQAEIGARVLDAPTLGDSTASALAASMLQHLPAEQQENLVIREAFLRRLPLDVRRMVEVDETLNIWELAKAADKRLKGRVHPPLSNTGTNPEIAAATGARPKVKAKQDPKPTSQGKKSGPKTWCWVHRKFGQEARNCVNANCEWPNYPVSLHEIQEN